MNDMMNNFLGVVFTMARWAGIFLAVFGAYNLVTSFTEDRPEEKKKAIGLIIGGIALTALKSIIDATNLLNSTGNIT